MRNAVVLFTGPVVAIVVMALTLLGLVAAMWWFFGPDKRQPRRVRGRPYRFRDDRNGPLP